MKFQTLSHKYVLLRYVLYYDNCYPTTTCFHLLISYSVANVTHLVQLPVCPLK